NDFAHRVAVAVAEIVKSLPARLESEHVRLSEVHDVNIVPDTRAVRRGIIGPENLALRRLAERDFQDVRNQMSLDAMMFAEFFARAGGVEIAKGDEFQSVNLAVPLENLLEHQF